MSEWAGLGTSKKETFLKVKAPHEMKKIFKQKIFTMHNFWDTAVCLHFWTGTKLGPIMYFVNKQLTYSLKNWGLVDFSPDFGLSGLNEHFLKFWRCTYSLRRLKSSISCWFTKNVLLIIISLLIQFWWNFLRL